jgi:hypothetical protein
MTQLIDAATRGCKVVAGKPTLQSTVGGKRDQCVHVVRLRGEVEPAFVESRHEAKELILVHFGCTSFLHARFCEDLFDGVEHVVGVGIGGDFGNFAVSFIILLEELEDGVLLEDCTDGFVLTQEA